MLLDDVVEEWEESGRRMRLHPLTRVHSFVYRLREARNFPFQSGQPRCSRGSLAGLAFWLVSRMQHAPRETSLRLVAIFYMERADLFLRGSAAVSLAVSGAACAVLRAIEVAAALAAILASPSRRRAVLDSEALLLSLAESDGVYIRFLFRILEGGREG